MAAPVANPSQLQAASQVKAEPEPLRPEPVRAQEPAVPASTADVAQDPPPGALEAAVEKAPSAPPTSDSPSAPGQATHGMILKLDGLIESPSPDFYYYEWTEGDSFTALAERFYGSTRNTALLLGANEGKSAYNLRPGDRIWIPVQEPGKQSGVLGNHYVVEEGDNLSSIAGKVYGDSGDWNRIFEANRDLMSDPNRLKVGMRLRIP